MTIRVFEEGIHSISNDEYHASVGVSRSALWTFKQLPKLYWYQYLSGEYVKPKESDAYVVGNMVHTLVLEPELFDSTYTVMPELDRRTKAGKLAYDEALHGAIGKTLVTPEQRSQAFAMAGSLKSQELVNDVIRGSQFEQSIFWRDKETGIMCKARPDIMNTLIHADLKTTGDASLKAFQSSSMNFGYFLQAAMLYEATLSIDEPFEKFIFICVEKKPPYCVGMYMLDDEALQYGLKMFRKLIRQYAECLSKNDWPGLGVQSLTVPNYAIKDYDYE